MTIDFHVHAYPDKIAERAIKTLTETRGAESSTDGTESGARVKLKSDGVDYGVLLPIATNVKQQSACNDWAAENYRGNIISFGTVHPDAPDCLSELERIKSLGLRGIKLHPEYQDFYLFEDKVKPIWRKCGELGLPITLHMGYDPISVYVRRAMPYCLREIALEFPRTVFIGAHLGGMLAFEETYRYLTDLPNVYLDTAYLSGYISEEVFVRIIRKIGAEKVLFGSDLPFSSPKYQLDFILSLPISDEEKRLIVGENAARLLEIS